MVAEVVAVPVDTDKLVKIMNMLESTFENERLAAITLAQKIVKDSGQTWEQLLKGKTQPSAPFSLNMDAAKLYQAQQTGYNRGFQDGIRRGQQASATQIRSQIDDAYKRGVKETMDNAQKNVKELIRQAYERGRASAQHETVKTPTRIKWDEFAVNALDGQYGSISSWYKQFLLNIVNFPKVSPKQLIVLQRLSDDLDTNLTILA
jgi:hypothetical protein